MNNTSFHFGAKKQSRNRKIHCSLGLGLSFLFLASCATTPTSTTPTQTEQRSNSPYHVAVTNLFTPANMNGQKLIRVALLAPISSTNPAVKEEAETLEAAARLALRENGDGKTVLFVEDSGNSPMEATIAAKSALSKGADVILGPLFASGVSAVVPYAQENHATLFSFSTDTTQAGRGVYVFSFLPEDEANRIISYAGNHGINRLVLILPNGRYGDIMLEAATNAARRNNINILGTQRYDATTNAAISSSTAARAAAALVRGGQRGQTAIFIPERGPLLRNIVQTLSTNGASTSRVRYLGTGQWNEAATISDSRLLGSWFVSVDVEGRNAFEARLRTASNHRATRLAGLGYDIMSMIARLGRGGDKASISDSAIENPQGFQGVDGKYRFKNNVVERSLAIAEISPNGARIIDEASGQF